MRKTIALLLSLCMTPVFAQRDFLTADEADQIREVQEPSERLKLYLKFAELRVELVSQLLAKEKVGRSGMIHTNLQQLTEIIDAIDTVVEDSLRRKKPIESLAFVTKSEKDMSAKLQKWLDAQPKDLERYQFAMTTAIDTLNDSAASSEEDLATRAKDIQTQDAAEQKRREGMVTPETTEAAKKNTEKEDAQKKKAPTLLRKGETIKKQ